MRERLILLYLVPALLFSSFAFGNSEACNQSNPTRRAQKQICEAECEAFYQENPEARPPNRIGVCETTSERIVAQLSSGRRLRQALACGNGSWDGLLSVPDQVRGYLKFARDASVGLSQGIQERNTTIRACQANLECKVDLAKGLLRFEGKNPNDPAIVNYASTTHALTLMLSLERESHVRQSACLEAFRIIRGRVVRELDFDNRNSQVYPLIYQRLLEQSPDCPSRLGLQDPDTPKQDLPSPAADQSWLASLGIKLQCYNSEKIAELTCLELASFILDPLNLAIGGGLYLKALKTAGMRKSTHTELDAPRATQLLTRRRPQNFANRNQLVQSYLQREFTTEAQNRSWIASARTTQPDGKHLFLDIENSRLKFLNDSLNDKDLVTALTNRHKEIVLQNLDELRAKYPKLEILEYSDFKSLRFAFRQPTPPGFQNELSQVLLKSNEVFRQEMVTKGILRSNDEAQNWFRAGLGETADQANAAAKYSRSQSEVKLENFNNVQLRARFNSDLSRAETLRDNLSQNSSFSPLMESVNQGAHKIPRREVFESVRKASNASDLQKNIQLRFNQNLSIQDTENLIEYVRIVDSFTPGIHVAKREVVTAEAANRGAVTLDFTGMGAYNLRETALAMTRSPDLDTALEQTRLAERRVTQMFERRMNERINIIDNFLGQKKNLSGLHVRCSGDDCIGIFPSRITLKDQRDLVQRLSRSDSPSGVRISFISDRVGRPEMRNQLAQHGETIEKVTRKELAGKIPDQILSNLTFGVSMKGEAVGRGGVQLLIGNSRQLLSPGQLEQIKQAFGAATRKVNEDISRQTRLSIQYQALQDIP